MKITSTNPSQNYEVLGEVEASTEEDVQKALPTARQAQSAWAALSLSERCEKINSFIEISKQRSEDIARLMSQEMGKPIKSSRSQVTEALEYFQAYMDMAPHALAPEVVFENDSEVHTVYREPRGVIACIGPWNFPFLNIPWQMGQALIAGNALLYKPSEEIILFGKFMDELIRLSDLPEGVFNVLLGDGSLGEIMVQQPVDAILFTGSSRTGQRITELAATNSTPVLTELGGSAPGIIFEDADVPKIIETLYAMRFDNSGQYCDGLKRLMVHESKLDEVLTALKDRIAKTKVGDALDETIDMGPLVAKRQLETLEAQVQDAVDKGAIVVIGGRRPAGLQGAYYEPTVLTNITFDMRVWREEVFGPVLPVVTFSNEEEAIRLANDTVYGLAGFVFTENKDRYLRVAKQIQTGVIGHNNALFYSPRSPFGGYKESGNGRTNGVIGFHEVTKSKLISDEK